MEVIKNTEKWETENRDMFGESEKVLDVLKEKRIFDIVFDERDKTFGIAEMCDEYFGADLTLDMCKDLSELFSKIAKRIEETNNQ